MDDFSNYSQTFNKRAGPLIKTAVKIAWGPAYLSPAGSGYSSAQRSGWVVDFFFFVVLATSGPETYVDRSPSFFFAL